MKKNINPANAKVKKSGLRNQLAKPEASAVEIRAGHYIRRLHQISDAIFKEETRSLEITPAQVAVLFAVKEQENIDQNTVARTIDFDAATVGGVIDRLEKRGLILRQTSPTDRRVKLLKITASGIKLTDAISPIIGTIQKRLFAPLTEKDQINFAKMLKILIEARA